MTDLFVGLMSGTSMDGIDAVLVGFDQSGVQIRATHTQHYPSKLRDALLAAIREPLDVELDPAGELDREVGECFRDAALAVLARGSADKEDVLAIGSHGQTLRHQPDAAQPFSLQIGDPDVIAAGTGITTIANFRQADIAAGGQGAPLVPPFHDWLFGSTDSDRVVINIGGIANITILSAESSIVTGFDTGPGNGLMDVWVRKHLDQTFDTDGRWAAAGKVINPLLERMLADPYFVLEPPKSTGFEYFNLDWLGEFGIDQHEPIDVQATLCELSAASIANAIKQYAADSKQALVCGGGTHNPELMRRLSTALPELSVASTAAVGLDPDWVEAVAFAWLAMRTLSGQTGNLPTVTGASHKVVLGEIHSP